MGRTQTFEINSRFFASKAELEEYIKSILHGTETNTPIGQEYFAFVAKLLEMHPSHAQKVGSGIKEIIVLPDELYKGKTKCFWILRTDGTRTDFSYKACIRNNWTNEPMEVFREAARRAIDPQIAAYREDYIHAHMDAIGYFPCEKTQKLLQRKDEHVDHQPPEIFDAIIISFLELYQIDLSKIEYSGYGDGEIVKEFKDDFL